MTTQEAYEFALKQPGTFIEFPVMGEGGYDRLIVLHPKFNDPEVRDVIIRILNGDGVADLMLRNRAVFEKAFNS